MRRGVAVVALNRGVGERPDEALCNAVTYIEIQSVETSGERHFLGVPHHFSILNDAVYINIDRMIYYNTLHSCVFDYVSSARGQAFAEDQRIVKAAIQSVVMATGSDSLAADVASILFDQLQQQRRSTGRSEALRPAAEQHPPGVLGRWRRLGRSYRARRWRRGLLLHGQLCP